LLGQYTAVIHRDDENLVVAYHRKDKGGPEDDTVVVVNFGGTSHPNYELPFPYEGTWRVRFNSSWKGYNVDFSEVPIETTKTTKKGATTIAIAPYTTLIFSIDA
jgi:1,4-alpha-glucan branching enzyme